MAPLFGLVLAGGLSERMGADKGLLRYRGKPHRIWLCDVLSARCDRAFISVSARQERVRAGRCAYIGDAAAYAGSGPIGALLSAGLAHPGAAWLVVSCDLPFFDDAAARALIEQRDPAMAAAAFVNPETGQPEPLATLYEPAFMAELPAAFARGERSLRRLLSSMPARLISDFDRRWIAGADTPEDARRAMEAIRHFPSRRQTRNKS